MNGDLARLREMREQALAGGGPRRIDEQHERGKMTARERLALLLDEGSFQEIGALATHNCSDFGMAAQRYPGDGVVAGFGKINGRRVAVFAHDFTVLGGSLSVVQSQKICRVHDLAMESGIPLIGLNDSGGARIQEGVRSLAAYGEMFTRNVLASGVIPQISVILGPCAGGAVYSPALTDFVIMTEQHQLHVHHRAGGDQGGDRRAGERRRPRRPGGAQQPERRRAAAGRERAAGDRAGEAAAVVPAAEQHRGRRRRSCRTTSPDRMDERLNTIVPASENEPYDMHEVIEAVFDRDSFLEIHPYFARNAIVGFARLDGHSVGIVANQPAHLAGALDIDSSDKIARFVSTCDAFNVPIVTFVDTPGYLPGVDQEHYGIIRHGSKVIYAFCQATVPKITIVTRKAMGGAYVAMCSKQMRSDLAFAWPSAQIAVMGAVGAVRVLRRKELAAAADAAAREREFVDEYHDRFMNPYMAADTGQIDEVIEPRETRPRLVRALEVLRTKVQQNPPKKHGIIPM